MGTRDNSLLRAEPKDRRYWFDLIKLFSHEAWIMTLFIRSFLWANIYFDKSPPKCHETKRTPAVAAAILGVFWSYRLSRALATCAASVR